MTTTVGERPPASRSFTLVETLMALTLAAMLGVGLAGIVAGVGHILAVSSRSGEAMILADCQHMLDLDLTNAREARIDGRTVYLRGVGAIDPDRSRLTHRPVEIVYLIVRVGERSALVRRQFDALHPDTKPERSDIVAFDVGSLCLALATAPPSMVLGDRGAGATKQAEPAPAVGAAWAPIPAGARWIAVSSDKGGRL